MSLAKSTVTSTPKKSLVTSFTPSGGKQGSEASTSTAGSSKNHLHTPDDPQSPKFTIRDGSQRRDSKIGDKKPTTAIMTIDLNKVIDTKTTQLSREHSQDKTAKKVHHIIRL
jgi:hypothetical protein